MSNETTNLALVPLHPGCVNKKEPVVKVFPLVLGRTNLANWWWNSCPCEKYCRLHCKPVAQNIRSLSKVMMMVDSKAQLRAVGKNPHLVTVTPERTDGVLKENDIICIGRRDREPWMRFQVVQANGAGNHRRSRRRERRRNISADGQTRSVDPRRSNINPPEWITTTSRKRKISRLSSGATTPNPSNPIGGTQQTTTTNTDVQKRRRKRPRDSSFRLGSRTFDEINSIARLDKHLQALGQNKAAHHMHLVAQDCKTGATLLESDRERRRDMSERFAAESQGGRLFGGRLPFLSKRIEEDAEEQTPSDSAEAIRQEGAKEQAEIQQQPYLSQPPIAKVTTVSSKLPTDEQVDWQQLEGSCGDEQTASAKGAGEAEMAKSNVTATVERSNCHPMTLTPKEAEHSIVHMPAVGTNQSTLSPANRSANRTVQYSSAGLLYWQQIARGEPDKVSAFRRALAGLIVAKNRGKEEGDPMWLPDLLDDDAVSIM